MVSRVSGSVPSVNHDFAVARAVKIPTASTSLVDIAVRKRCPPGYIWALSRARALVEGIVDSRGLIYTLIVSLRLHSKQEIILG